MARGFANELLPAQTAENDITEANKTAPGLRLAEAWAGATAAGGAWVGHAKAGVLTESLAEDLIEVLLFLRTHFFECCFGLPAGLDGSSAGHAVNYLPGS